MAKIKSLEELHESVQRQDEILVDVLISAYRIVDSYGPNSVVSFGYTDIKELIGLPGGLIEGALNTLKEKYLLDYMGMGGPNGVNYKMTIEGKEAARDVILQKIAKMEEIQEDSNRDSVFIIHGHDEGFKNSVALFIREIGLNPIILHEVEDRGRTIIEKLEAEIKKAKFAVALWSPDDIMANENKRARQNVILETGMFISQLSRDGVRILVKDQVEIPSDLDGVLRIPYSCDESWKNRLKKEIVSAGIAIKQ